MNVQDLKNWEDRYQLQTYAKLPLSIEKGQGCYVYDSQGTSYLDMYGGHCVSSTGHCHPRVVQAIQEQVSELIFYSNAVYSGIRGKAVEKLLGCCSPPYYQVFLVNSGAEANDNAIKLSRAVTGRTEVISTQNAFHGRTYGSLSATGIGKFREYLNTPVPDHRISPLEDVVPLISEKTAAVFLEPIQSMGGVVEAPIPVLKQIEAACLDQGALLIFDEIQTGVGRTGSFLYSQKIGVTPDITTLAKGIASGYPAGAVLVTEKVSQQVGLGDLGSTFGGNPVACAAIYETLSVIQEEGLIENAASLGDYIADNLSGLNDVEEVRGEGLLLGIRFKHSVKAIQKALLEEHILTGTSNDPTVLRLMPPLTLTQEQADHFIKALKSL
jgi:acetylornithine/succinyldiaminopimelate/putrescine aminotransferase